MYARAVVRSGSSVMCTSTKRTSRSRTVLLMRATVPMSASRPVIFENGGPASTLICGSSALRMPAARAMRATSPSVSAPLATDAAMRSSRAWICPSSSGKSHLHPNQPAAAMTATMTIRETMVLTVAPYLPNAAPTRRERGTVPISCRSCRMLRLSPTTKYSSAPNVTSASAQSSRLRA